MNKSQEQSETLKETIDRLAKAHAVELSRTTAQLQQQQQQQQQDKENQKYVFIEKKCHLFINV